MWLNIDLWWFEPETHYLLPPTLTVSIYYAAN